MFKSPLCEGRNLDDWFDTMLGCDPFVTFAVASHAVLRRPSARRKHSCDAIDVRAAKKPRQLIFQANELADPVKVGFRIVAHGIT